MSLLGKLFYKLYYAPKHKTYTKNLYGGKKNYQLILESEQKMRTYALNELKISSNFSKDGKYRLNFLTGEKHVHQSIFCVYSFFKQLTNEEAANFSVTFFDDGSLDKELKTLLNNRFPNICVVTYNDVITTLSNKLPKNEFPYIHKNSRDLFFFNKLFFLHTHNPGFNIYLDSDMLFHNKPTELLDWLDQNINDNEAAFGIEDIEKCYGYNNDILDAIDKEANKTVINAGFYGINSSRINFDFLEALIKKIEDNYGSDYYMEQFTTAILLNPRKFNTTILPKDRYIVFPSKNQIINAEGVLHHYVNVSKEWYFKNAWRIVANKN